MVRPSVPIRRGGKPPDRGALAALMFTVSVLPALATVAAPLIPDSKLKESRLPAPVFWITKLRTQMSPVSGCASEGAQLGSGSLANAFISLAIGLLISTVGTDPIYGSYRFTFGLPILSDGIEFLVVMVGAYGVGEVLSRLEQRFATKPLGDKVQTKTELPSLREIWDIKGMFLRSSLLGNIIGTLSR